jgi:hypothetical protein
MPLYTYSNPADSEDVIEIIQSMSETHEYIKDGVKWERIWEKPRFNSQGSSKIDPFDKKKFIDKTGKMKGTYGDILDYSKELSEERKSKMGYDPEQNKFFNDFKKEKGYKHHKDRPEKVENDFISFDDLTDN